MTATLPCEQTKPTQAKPTRLLQISNGVVTVDQAATQKAFASVDSDFIDGLLHQIVNVGSSGKTADEKGS